VTDGPDTRKVALFVDFEHLRRHTEGAHAVCGLSSAIEAVALRVQDMGDVVMANVYADWDKVPGRQGEVKRLHLDPRFVFSNLAGTSFQLARTNGSLVSMALDALDALREHPEIDTFVLVSDDAGIADLITRLRRDGRDVFLVGFQRSMPPDLLSMDVEFEPLEDSVQPAELQHEDTPPSEEAYSDSDFSWEAFVLLLARLEDTLPFVSLKYLKNHVLTPNHGGGSTNQSKGELIRRAIHDKLIDTHKIPNPRNPEFGTTVCVLNRRHPDVRRILELG